MVVWIEFKDIRGHSHCSKGRHHGGNGDKDGGKPILCFCKISLTCKEVSIKQADSKTKVYYQGRYNTLPADIAHGLKIRSEKRGANPILPCLPLCKNFCRV